MHPTGPGGRGPPYGRHPLSTRKHATKSVSMKRNRSVMLLLTVAGLFLVLGGLLAGGFLDFLAMDGHIERGPAMGCLVAYWLVTSLGALAVAYASSHWRELLLALVATLITVGFAEAVLRWIGTPWAMRRLAAVSSSDYHHIYPPNRDMFMGAYEGGQPVFVRTNEDGLRTPYTREEFGKYPDRVVLLGDSFVFGYRVRQERGLTAVTERLLRSRLGDNQVAVLNAGVVSYSPFLERLLLAGKLKHYQPTLVVLLLDASDIGDDIQYQAEARANGDRIFFDLEVKERAPYHGAVFELVRRLFESIPPLPRDSKLIIALAYPFRQPGKKKYDYYGFKVTIGNVLETSRFFIYRHPLEETRSYFSKTLENINAVAREAEQINARFVLAINPRFHHWNPAEVPENWEKFDYALNEPYQYEYFRFFEEARSQVNYPIFNLLPAFQATRQFPLVFKRDPHWNEQGNEFAARVLVNYLIETRMIGQ